MGAVGSHPLVQPMVAQSLGLQETFVDTEAVATGYRESLPFMSVEKVFTKLREMHSDKVPHMDSIFI